MTRKLDKLNITDARHGAAFAVRIVTRAQRDEIVGQQEDGSLKIRLTASPNEGEANAALITFLATRLGVEESAVEIVAGHQHRDKMITVEGVDAAMVDEMLKADAAPDSQD